MEPLEKPPGARVEVGRIVVPLATDRVGSTTLGIVAGCLGLAGVASLIVSGVGAVAIALIGLTLVVTFVAVLVVGHAEEAEVVVTPHAVEAAGVRIPAQAISHLETGVVGGHHVVEVRWWDEQHSSRHQRIAWRLTAGEARWLVDVIEELRRAQPDALDPRALDSLDALRDRASAD